MRRAYRFPMRPTAGQHQRLAECLDDHRELYNAALQVRRDAFERVVRRSGRKTFDEQWGGVSSLSWRGGW